MKKKTDKPFRLLKGDWYFEGYKGVMVPRRNGRGMKRELVYIGTYYHFDRPSAGIRRLKIAFVLLYVLALTAYLALNLAPFTAVAFPAVGIPLLLAVIPMIYHGIGIVSLCFAPEEMTIRNRYSSIRRIKRAVCVGLAFSAMTMVGDLWFLIAFRGNYFPSEFIFPFLCVLLLIGLSISWYLLLKNPLQPVKKEKDETLPLAPDEAD